MVTLLVGRSGSSLSDLHRYHVESFIKEEANVSRFVSPQRLKKILDGNAHVVILAYDLQIKVVAAALLNLQVGQLQVLYPAR